MEYPKCLDLVLGSNLSPEKSHQASSKPSNLTVKQIFPKIPLLYIKMHPKIWDYDLEVTLHSQPFLVACILPSLVFKVYAHFVHLWNIDGIQVRNLTTIKQWTIQTLEVISEKSFRFVEYFTLLQCIFSLKWEILKTCEPHSFSCLNWTVSPSECSLCSTLLKEELT